MRTLYTFVCRLFKRRQLAIGGVLSGAELCLAIRRSEVRRG